MELVVNTINGRSPLTHVGLYGMISLIYSLYIYISLIYSLYIHSLIIYAYIYLLMECKPLTKWHAHPSNRVAPNTPGTFGW
jgi:hypothetical protein